MQILHNCEISNWNKAEVLSNAKILILGSFNPFNPNGVNPDYYYGRESNYFWKEIAYILNLNSSYFQNNLSRKIDFLLSKKICFLDFVKSIEITEINENNTLLNNFVKKIFLQIIQIRFCSRVNQSLKMSILKTLKSQEIIILKY